MGIPIFQVDAFTEKPFLSNPAGVCILSKPKDERWMHNVARGKEAPARGVIVTSRAQNSEYDFVSRFFAPAVGVNEDPVTGSAH